MTKNVEQRLVTIPVPANYLSFETMIGGVKKNDLRVKTYGGVSIPLFFVEVPEEMAKELLKLVWAEYNFEKNTRDDLSLDEIPVDIPDENTDDPLQMIIEKEKLESIEELVEYLSSKNPCYGEIFMERFDGNFNKSDIALTIGKPETTTRRWIRKTAELAEEFVAASDIL